MAPNWHFPFVLSGATGWRCHPNRFMIARLTRARDAIARAAARRESETPETKKNRGQKAVYPFHRNQRLF
jgi:hypothetical protein